MSNYDKEYSETENLFGKPYSGLIKFFKEHPNKGKLLDLGCGQGRDTIPLAKMGYTVTGVDNSKVGINQMMKKSRSTGLKVQGIVDNIYNYPIEKKYDIVLLDSLFHFEKRDYKKEKAFLQRIMEELKIGGILCLFVWKSKRIEKSMFEIIDNSKINWEILENKYVDYPEHNMQYRLYIIRKLRKIK